jgi:hypothetical protein
MPGNKVSSGVQAAVGQIVVNWYEPTLIPRPTYTCPLGSIICPLEIRNEPVPVVPVVPVVPAVVPVEDPPKGEVVPSSGDQPAEVFPHHKFSVFYRKRSMRKSHKMGRVGDIPLAIQHH